MSLPALPDDPLVSVLVTNYNNARFLDRALDSVSAQTWTNLEIVVCDDRSTDESPSVLRKWQDREPRGRVVVTPENMGQAGALNAAFRAASGDVIALLDSDDWWDETKVARCVSVLREQPDVGYLAHSLRVVDVDERAMFRRRVPPFPGDGWLAPRMLRGWRGDVGVCSGMIVRREVADVVFDLSTSWPVQVDQFFAERCAFVTRAAVLDEDLGGYRIHGSNVLGLSLTSVDATVTSMRLDSYRALAAERAAFAARVHGVVVDGPRLERLLTGTLELRLSVLRGERLPWRRIRAVARGRAHAMGWMFFFVLPPRVGGAALRTVTGARLVVKRRDWRLRGPRKHLRDRKRLRRKAI